MEQNDTITKGIGSWMARHRRTLEFLKQPGLGDYLVKKGCPPGPSLRLTPGRKRPFGNNPNNGITVALTIMAGEHGRNVPWLRFTSGMMRHLATCRRDPGKIPLMLAVDPATHLEVREDTKPLKSLMREKYEEEDDDLLCACGSIGGSTQKVPSYTVYRNLLGSQGDQLAKSGVKENYLEAVGKYQTVLRYMLEAADAKE